MSSGKYKILALDGGGIRGVVTAKILQEVESQLGKPLNQYFDLIAGTSTGSILAAGLVMGKSIEEMIGIYQNKGETIFKQNIPQQITSWLFGPKYSNDGLIRVLKDQFKETTLRELHEKTPKPELLILAYDMLHRNTTFFQSGCYEKKRWFNDMKLWEICASSASAPTFFHPYEFRWKDPELDNFEWSFPHVDGGVSANCPAMAALCHVLSVKKEEIKNKEFHLEDISILSIGTGRTTEPFEYAGILNWGKLTWAEHITDVFMGGQIQIATAACEAIIQAFNPNGYLRLQFDLNERFENKKLLDHDDQVNKYTKKRINEAMDNASKENIDDLLEAASKYAAARKTEIQTFIKAQDLVTI
ncbi:patatin-like phospholipase family protein [Nostoc sp. FACHB-110]|uniref:patatin-like phospholipase family protein n=1 Tax=Nostoc sp. FACHB-110 TaxID=2692834 RepID=UPI001682025D|nr:patatin-like phospholipase family protein [Nostoc sp. FACHB-110]MBD2438201.1 patatin-like phospholipase family protein [Nostoc sp. FACHB-110]